MGVEAGESIAPNILGVSLCFKQNYHFKLLNSDSSLNLRVVTGYVDERRRR